MRTNYSDSVKEERDRYAAALDLIIAGCENALKVGDVSEIAQAMADCLQVAREARTS